MKLNHRSKAVAHVFECAFLSIQTGHASYLGNVFGFEKVIDIEEHFDGYAKLKEVVDNSLDAVGRLHLVGGEGPLLLAQRGGAALEDDLLDNPVMGGILLSCYRHMLRRIELDFPSTLVLILI